MFPYGWLTNTWKDAQHHSLSEKCKSSQVNIKIHYQYLKWQQWRDERKQSIFSELQNIPTELQYKEQGRTKDKGLGNSEYMELKGYREAGLC